MYSDKSDKENDQEHDESDNEVMGKSEESDTDTSERQDDSYIEPEPIEPLKETTYMEQSHEELGEVSTFQCQTLAYQLQKITTPNYRYFLPGLLFSPKNIYMPHVSSKVYCEIYLHF